jgi:drug/metabolite transporter (DMT)-like permease
VLTSLLLLALLAVRGTSPWPAGREGRYAIALGLLVAAQTAFVQVAVMLMPVTLAILVFYTYPFFTGVVMSVLGTDRMKLSLALALVAAFAGLTLVLGVGKEPVNPLGIAAGLGASASFTATLVLTMRLAPSLGAPLRTFLMMSMAAAVFVVASVVTRDFTLPETSPAWTGLLGLVICYAVGIILLFLCLPMLGPTDTAVILNMEPVAVALIAWLALGEALTPPQWAGALLVVAAVIFFQLQSRRR